MRKTLKDVEHLIYDTVDSAEQKGYERGREEGRKEGREELRKEFASEIVRRMIQQGFSDEEIQAALPLTADEISELKNETCI